MTSHTSAASEDGLWEPEDFSLVLGGLLFQLLRRSHLSGDALELMRRRLIIIPLLPNTELDVDAGATVKD